MCVSTLLTLILILLNKPSINQLHLSKVQILLWMTFCSVILSTKDAEWNPNPTIQLHCNASDGVMGCLVQSSMAMKNTLIALLVTHIVSTEYDPV